MHVSFRDVCEAVSVCFLVLNAQNIYIIMHQSTWFYFMNEGLNRCSITHSMYRHSQQICGSFKTDVTTVTGTLVISIYVCALCSFSALTCAHHTSPPHKWFFNISFKLYHFFSFYLVLYSLHTLAIVNMTSSFTCVREPVPGGLLRYTNYTLSVTVYVYVFGNMVE